MAGEELHLSIVESLSGKDTTISAAKLILFQAQDKILHLVLTTHNQKERLQLIRMARELGDLASEANTFGPDVPF